ncbi:uncharacterized protein LOC143245894 [Tachypleus tridentatus]|uniref:uncharacterized protein LOC143245894 n=1 Tax=Tachypleus tridentatus TaxID=6853 RepID=UPI003FD68B99
MCLLCEKVFVNDAMKHPNLKDYLQRIHTHKKDKDSGPILKCLPLSANRVQRRVDEMAEEKTLAPKLMHCKFSIQLDESTFGSSNIVMAYVRYFSKIQKQVIDELSFPRYLKGDAKGVTIFNAWRSI